MRDDARRLHRSGNIPVGTLYLDAKTDKEGVTIYDDKGYRIAGSSFLNLKVAKMSSFPGGELGLPRSIRATWLKGPFSSDSNGRWTGGTIGAFLPRSSTISVRRVAPCVSRSASWTRAS